MDREKRQIGSEVSLRDFSLYFGNTHVLKGLSVDMPQKKLTSVIVPSGCGKTSLLRCLNRFVDFEPDARITGRAAVGGQDIFSPDVDVTMLRKKIGMLSQKPMPLPMSIYENVAYGPKLHGVGRRGALDGIVKEKLVLADLWEEVKGRLDAPAGVLSIGQQQRLCIARALSVEPEIILADEPTSALDPIATARIEELLMRLKKNYTVVLATHNISQAKKVSDYAMHLYYGELVEAGWAKELFDTPKHPRTHAYIHGQSYEEHAIDAELDLCSRIPSQSYVEARRKLSKMRAGQVLRICALDRAKAGRLATGLKNDGHGILRTRKIEGDRWEILVRKEEEDQE